MPIAPGENVGPYRIIEQLGSGGMATVFKAYHPSLDRYVAIKILHPAFKQDPQFYERFNREARIVANLEHPNIIPVYDFNQHNDEPYLVMRFVEGDTLKAHMGDGPMSAPKILQLMRPVCQALDYAHRQGVLHRDIKPSNIMITHDGSIFLTDFGLARMVEAGESTLSQDVMVGTPQYISPEQAQGIRELDGRTDIYSLGVVLFEMLTGRVPFSADTPFATVHDHIYTPLPIPSDINPKISNAEERLLLKALAKDPEDRFAAAGDLLTALESTLNQQTVLHPSAQMLPATSISKKRGMPWWGWVGAATVGLCVMAMLLLGLLMIRARNRQLQPPLNEPVSGQVANDNPPANSDAPLPPPESQDKPAPDNSDIPPTPPSPPQDASNNPTAQELTRKANDAMRAEQVDDAIELYEQAIAEDPHFLPAYLGLSHAQQQKGDKTASLNTLENAVHNNPQNAAAWARLGEGQLFTARNPEAALNSFREAGALEPENPIAYAGQAIALTAMGQPAAAKETIDKALALDPANPEAHLANAYYLKEQGEPLAAARELKNLLQQNRQVSPQVRERARQLLNQLVE